MTCTYLLLTLSISDLTFAFRIERYTADKPATTLSTSNLPPGSSTLAHREATHPNASSLAAPPSPTDPMRILPSAAYTDSSPRVRKQQGDLPPPIELDKRPTRSGSIAISHSSATSAQPSAFVGQAQPRVPASAGSSQIDGTEPKIFPGVVNKHRSSSVQQRPIGILSNEKDSISSTSPVLGKTASPEEAGQLNEPSGVDLEVKFRGLSIEY